MLKKIYQASFVARFSGIRIMSISIVLESVRSKVFIHAESDRGFKLTIYDENCDRPIELNITLS